MWLPRLLLRLRRRLLGRHLRQRRRHLRLLRLLKALARLAVFARWKVFSTHAARPPIVRERGNQIRTARRGRRPEWI